MSWAFVQRRALPFLSPAALESWLVQRTRRGFVPVRAAPSGQARRLYLDVTVISKNDAGTGIQRMVRAVAMQLLASPPPGWEVHAVGATRKRPYHVIRWGKAAPADALPHGQARPIEARPGDVFLGLDLALDTVRFHRGQLADFRHHGGQLWFVMYDLLPVQRPEWFSDKLVVRYRKWMRVLAGLADGFHCISPTVETDLRAELRSRYGLAGGYQTTVLPMGWDLATARPSTGLPTDFPKLQLAMQERCTALVVGTIEPRKGHADVLAAFELLWANGHASNLVIVGRPGWHTEALQRRIRTHPENGRRLFWLEDASDEALSALYASCDGVIAASLGEGYGLPVLEALGHGRRVLARDLPVFRSHPRECVSHFPADATPTCLADHVRSWLARDGTSSIAVPTATTTWADTARAIVDAIAAPVPGEIRT